MWIPIQQASGSAQVLHIDCEGIANNETIKKYLIVAGLFASPIAKI
jgi:hypothetical protein